MNRIQQFNNTCQRRIYDTYDFNFDELIEIEFKTGCRPRNATDYYYHVKTKTFYAYYFGDKGSWSFNPEIDTYDIKSPGEASSDQSIAKNRKFELDDYKLELEIMKLKAEIKLEKLKTKSKKYIK